MKNNLKKSWILFLGISLLFTNCQDNVTAETAELQDLNLISNSWSEVRSDNEKGNYEKRDLLKLKLVASTTKIDQAVIDWINHPNNILEVVSLNNFLEENDGNYNQEGLDFIIEMIDFMRTDSKQKSSFNNVLAEI
ncbi:MAG: hypothetical protein ACPGUH_00565 [Winogradskyella sp.]